QRGALGIEILHKTGHAAAALGGLLYGPGSWRATPKEATGIWQPARSLAEGELARSAPHPGPLPAGGERVGVRGRGPSTYCNARQARSMRAQASLNSSFEVA